MISNILDKKYSNYRFCIVSECKNTSIKTPEKLWIRVPSEANMRNTWLKLAERDPLSLSSKYAMYFCEDHFNIERDMDKYLQYKLMGSVKRDRMEADCIPSRFESQTLRKRKVTPTSNQLHALKKGAIMSFLADDKQIYPTSCNQVQCEDQAVELKEEAIEIVEEYLEIKNEPQSINNINTVIQKALAIIDVCNTNEILTETCDLAITYLDEVLNILNT